VISVQSIADGRGVANGCPKGVPLNVALPRVRRLTDDRKAGDRGEAAR
jgi:hypothetical protein